jgi:hypothetical protein
VSVVVNVENFVRAESDLMFSRLVAQSGGTGRWFHHRQPAPIDDQPIVRLNRDTLYSSAVLDVAGAATITMPDTGNRYASVMIVNQDHYIPVIFHEPGTYELSSDEVGSRYVLAGVRMLVDPADPADVAAVNRLQDGLALETASNVPFALADYDQPSQNATRAALIELSRGLADFRGAFGRAGEVDPVRRLLAAASAWGGLPEYEAHYANVEPGLPVGAYRIRMADVPVDAFWSISVYGPDGFFVANDIGVYNLNSVTTTPDPDGATTINFGPEPDGRPNFIPIPESWNFLIRLYRPRPDALDGTWATPPVEPAS